jgi:hypothetical protein
VLSISRMSEQKLDGTKVSRSSVDQHRFGAPQRMGAELRRVEPDTGDPLLNEPGILTSGRPAIGITPAGEQKLSRLPSCHPQVFVDCLPRMVGQLKPNRPTRLLLAYNRAIHGVTTWRHITDADGDHVAAAQFAIYR